MSTVKLKTKASFDLPAFVRDDYKIFTSFVDAYHEWLDANQADIKTLSDIDSTLESFISNFKSEIDYKGIKFPNIDERFLLRHIKKLYLSKGTEESYKTLFKLLFDKDVIIKYPEQMTIKPSDGKWNQIISMFVEVSVGDATSLKNRIVKVTTNSTKQVKDITVENVILRRTGGGISTVSLAAGGSGYSSPVISFTGSGTGATAHAIVQNGIITSIVVDTPGIGYVNPPAITITGTNTTVATVSAVRMFMMPDIYEFNINKHYYGTIGIDDVVTFGTFTGKVIPTINSATIKNAGKNFRLGQTFAVDTLFGRGTTVKVSKLESGTYGIAEIKFIQFGFGYISDFESSSIIPPNISQSQDTQGFTGLNGSFVEYIGPRPSGGYILNETYTTGSSNTLYNISGTVIHSPVNSAVLLDGAWTTHGQIIIDSVATLTGTWSIGSISAADGIYSTDYAGEVNREFYSSNVYNGDPSNGALIEFKLGAICKYPGYYISSDGITSDINKLQDSFLYQKYSYILQTDEKLETYKDVVKSFIHPAGMALFGEYSMYNEFVSPIKLTALLSRFSINHVDSYHFDDLKYFQFDKIVNDSSNALLGTQPDVVSIYEVNRNYTFFTCINDPNDSVDPQNDSESFNFVGYKSESISPTDSNSTFILNQSFIDSVINTDYIVRSSINSYDDSINAFDSLSFGDLVIKITDSNDTTAISDSGTITKNLYMDNMAQYVIGDYVSPPDSSFGYLVSPVGSSMILDNIWTSSGAIQIIPDGEITINGIWTLN